MIYVDTSVVLAHLLAEDRHPPDSLWTESLVASRLLEYELWNCLHTRNVTGSHADAARMVLSRVAFLELARPVLERALKPFPIPVRTLEALHLASIAFLRERGYPVVLATYDARMGSAAQAMGVELFSL